MHGRLQEKPGIVVRLEWNNRQYLWDLQIRPFSGSPKQVALLRVFCSSTYIDLPSILHLAGVTLCRCPVPHTYSDLEFLRILTSRQP